MKIFTLLAAMAALIFAVPSLHAQVVWTTNTGQPNVGAYTGTDADIQTNGTFVAAVLFAGIGSLVMIPRWRRMA